jgi:hypothetical protein
MVGQGDASRRGVDGPEGNVVLQEG